MSNNTNGAFVKAFAAAQADMKNATLNKTNPHFNSKYADLAEIRDCTVPILARHGIATTQLPVVDDNGTFVLVTQLLFNDTVHLEAQFPLPANTDKPQQIGSAITYARRYSLASICCISADDDDDGNAAQAGTSQAAAPPRRMSAQQAKREIDWQKVEGWIAEANNAKMIDTRRAEINNRANWPQSYVTAALELIEAQEAVIAADNVPASSDAAAAYLKIALEEVMKRPNTSAAWTWFENERQNREQAGLTGEQEAQITDALIAEFGPEPARDTTE